MSAPQLRPAFLAVAPTLSAILAACAGILLLASGATPAEPTRFAIWVAVAPGPLIEVSHFVSSILGLVLVLLAFGLRSRLDAAWWAALFTLAAGAILALFKGLNWEETVILTAIMLAMLPFHEAFPRKAALSRMEITPGWLLSAAAALIGVALCGWWTFAHTEYADQSVMKTIGDREVARAIRSSAAAAIVLMAIGVWRLIATAATPPVVDDTDPDFDRVRAILAKAENAEPRPTWPCWATSASCSPPRARAS
jgi:lysylphosphatidylglycerol synthetase-like protein (DUF2156 family)